MSRSQADRLARPGAGGTASGRPDDGRFGSADVGRERRAAAALLVAIGFGGSFACAVRNGLAAVVPLISVALGAALVGRLRKPELQGPAPVLELPGAQPAAVS